MLCQVCGKNISKYTCPACDIKTCSVDCIKRHKKETGCTGVKLKTSFVPLEKMNSQMLIKDCALLDEARSAVIDATSKKFPKKSKTDWQKLLDSQCQKSGITIHFLPRLMTRAVENKTRYLKKEDTIYWTCRFRFRNEDKEIVYDYLLHDISENSSMIDIFKAIVETAPNDFVAKANLDTFEILLVAEGSPGGGHFQIDLSCTLGENLFSKTLIEYPIFDVVPKNSLDKWNIVFYIGEMEEPKEQPAKTQKTELPSYEKIKDALKLDIISNVLKSSISKEEQNTPLPPDFNSDMKDKDPI